MSRYPFALQPFAPSGTGPDLALTGYLARRGMVLTMRYNLSGRLAAVAFPGPTEAPQRRHGLWEETCFEVFLGVKGAPAYWEFNLSPAGAWNVYHFTGYREGMAEESALVSLPFGVQRQPESLRLSLEVDLAGIVRPDQGLEAAVAAVIKLRGGRTDYWALVHPGPRPDFHRRDGFLIQLK